MNDLSKPRPVQLHVIHDLGGGSAKWLADYIEADAERTNLVLRSFAHDTAAGTGISLHASAAADAPAIRLWKWSEEIAATVVAHPEYKAALDEIVREFAVGGVLVSSLIGHSLEVLDTGLPTVVVNHDYFPYCPAINLYFDAICMQCNGQRIAQCEAENSRFNPFRGFAPAARLQVRERFVEQVHRANVTMAIPSRSVADNLRALDPRFDDVAFATIPHGYGHPFSRVVMDPGTDERLRIIVLGQLSVAKGVDLLRDALERITAFADVYLIGTKELGEEFRLRKHVHVVADYEASQLPGHIASIKPHVGLLLSVVPETFSYALSELMMLGVPVAATRLGSFAERIRHGVDGYLFDPQADALAGIVAHIDAHRDELSAVRANVAGWRPRSTAEMVADYHRILPLQPRMPGPGGRARVPSAGSEFATQALTLASMWKDLKALHRQVGLLHEGRQRDEASRQAMERRHEADRDVFERRIARSDEALRASEESIRASAERIEGLEEQLRLVNSHVAQLLASTSWRISAPVRWAGRLVKKAMFLARIAGAGLRQPGEVPGQLRKGWTVWRTGGLPALKRGLLAQRPRVSPGAWEQYRVEFARDVRPRIVARVASMKAKPRVSVLIPTYDTPEDTLQEVLASVERQIYPEWELCIADDGSTAPHVKRVLEEHAQRDSRIKLHLGTENQGVSHASNRALDMATGDFVVLLDHDDVLEEQALFRVAEAIVEDDPDMIYSDELQVQRDGESPRKFVYRPAFSLEYLRSHPYIVHMVAFRTTLLKAIGGFDEKLRISQDYDLILRAVEKARRIVHIPEILYRWRIHARSAGHARMHEVMEVSTAILQRHLERSGANATAREGMGFNLFDVRYTLSPEIRIAIVIPTKNHGRILRQCVDSIRATVKSVRYDIVIVDHESDDPNTLKYLASLDSSVRVLRYSGAFNFSAINNRAIAELPKTYSHYLLCNNDIEAIGPEWLERMAELAQHPDIGIVGAKLLYPDRAAVQHAGVLVGAFRGAEHYGKFIPVPDRGIEPGYECGLVVNREVSAVTAACMLVRRDAFEAVGGFDELLAVGFGDVDLCLRVLEKGYRVVQCAQAQLVHHESYTRGTSPTDPHPADTAEFQRKWARFLRVGDPYYNPNLSNMSTSWALREPMRATYEVKRRVYSAHRASVPGVAVMQPTGAGRITVAA